MSIITKASFTGEHLISQTQYSDAMFTSIIDEWERYFLVRLFGKELYDLFITDYALPVGDRAARFTVITAAFDVQDDDDVIHSSRGLATMLTGFIYGKIIKTLPVKMTASGAKKPQSDVSENLTANQLNGIIEREYNRSVDDYKAIRWYMETYLPDDYTEFNGVKIKKSYLGGAMFG